MNVFRSLRNLVGWVLGEDLSERPEAQKELATRRVHVPPSSSGDGFDVSQRAPLELAVPEQLLDDPPPGDVPASTDFQASFDDLKHLVDEPQGPQPEFIPEGGMSTESLMREFEVLDPQLLTQPPLEEAPAVEPVKFEPAEPVPAPPEEVPLAPAWLIPVTVAERAEAPPPTDFNASLDDLATPVANAPDEGEPLENK